MDWIDLGNPRPRAKVTPYSPLSWPITSRLALRTPSTTALPRADYAELALRRRTRREFGPVNLDLLGALLALTCRTTNNGHSDLGFPTSFRPCPSAGAIHPIHVVVLTPDLGWHCYDPATHALLAIGSALDPLPARTSMLEVVYAPESTLLFLAAEPGMTAAKYSDAASLVWRDAGVLIGLLALASEALDLSFCPLGVTGEPWISNLLDQPGLSGVGAALVGSAPRT